MTMTQTPVRYSPDVEDVKPDEAETITKLNETFDKILETTAEDYGHAVRSVHAKAHGFLDGVLVVHDRLSPELAQGLFATPGEHKVVMRFSTNAGDILPDTISLPRGLALKVMDVDGERLPGADGQTQDFVMVNGPVFQNKTAAQFLGKRLPLSRACWRSRLNGEGGVRSLDADRGQIGLEANWALGRSEGR
ncbi:MULTISPECIES: hypothetical protein [unclassified Sphingomonas]|uniref:hypothetical protein n=1 Tax=unclassified Sphingomonas TaxID=196159 RepID=UPI000A43D85A|nr:MULTISPECIES: hypothetical protein [unclassified Sphingomonas]